MISEDILKSTPVYQFTYNRDVVKYLLEPKAWEWGTLQKPNLTQNDKSDPDPFAKE